MAELEKLMGALAEETGAPPFRKNEDGGYSLVFDDLPEVGFHPLAGKRILVKARVSGVPEKGTDRDRLFKEILRVNLAGAGAREAVLSFDPASGVLGLHYEIPGQGMSGQDFRDMVQGFVNSLDFWCRTIQERLNTEPAGHVWPGSGTENTSWIPIR